MTVTVNAPTLVQTPYLAVVVADINYVGAEISLDVTWSMASGNGSIYSVTGEWTNGWDFTKTEMESTRTQAVATVFINDANLGNETVTVTVTDGAGYTETGSATIIIVPVATVFTAGADQALGNGVTTTALAGIKTNLPTLEGTRVTPATIVATVAGAADGDVIVMAGGEYPVEITTTRRLTFATEPKDWVEGRPAVFTSSTGVVGDAITYGLFFDGASASGGQVSGVLFRDMRGGGLRLDDVTSFTAEHMGVFGVGQAKGFVSFRSSGVQAHDFVASASNDVAGNGENGDCVAIVEAPANSGNLYDHFVVMGVADDTDLFGSQGCTLTDFITTDTGSGSSGDGMGMRLGGAGTSGDNHISHALLMNARTFGLNTNEITPTADFSANFVTIGGERSRLRDIYSDGASLNISNSIARGSPPDPSYNAIVSVNNSWDLALTGTLDNSYTASSFSYNGVWSTSLGDELEAGAAALGAKSKPADARPALPEVYGDEILWTQISGPAVTISDNTILTPTLTGLTDDNIYIFEVATAGAGQTDTVIVTTTLPATATAVNDAIGNVTIGLATNVNLATNDIACSTGTTAYVLTGPSANGTVTIGGSIAVVTPAAIGPGSQSYNILCDGVITDTATVTWTGIAVVADAVDVNMGGALLIGVPVNTNIAANDSACTAGTTTYALTGAAVNGATSLAGTTITVVPAATGPGSQSYNLLCDGTVMDTAVVSWTAAAPTAIATGDSFGNVVEGVATSLNISVNDTPCSSGATTYALTGSAVNGVAFLAGNVITVTADAVGPGSQSYNILCNGIVTDSAIVTWASVSGVSPGLFDITPSSTGGFQYNIVCGGVIIDSGEVTWDVPATAIAVDDDLGSIPTAGITPFDLALNDTACSLGATTYAVSGAATNGTVSITGSVASVMPLAAGPGSQDYNILCNGVITDTATITWNGIVVTATATNDFLGSITVGTASSLDLSANDVACSFGATTYALNGVASNGTVSLAGSVVSVTPAVAGAGSQNYDILCSGVTIDTATISWTTPPATATAVNDNMGSLIGGVGGVLDLSFNDTACSSGPTTYETSGAAVNGTVSITGSIATVDPTANGAGSQSYNILCNGVVTDTAIITWTGLLITATAVGDNLGALTANTARAIDVGSNDVTCTGGATTTYSAVAGSITGGIVSQSGNTSQFVLTPSSDGSFDYNILCAGAIVDTATVQWTIIRTAVANDDNFGSLSIGELTAVDVSTNDTPCTVGVTTYALLAGSQINATVVQAAVGGSIFNITPQAPGEFKYTILCDGNVVDIATVRWGSGPNKGRIVVELIDPSDNVLATRYLEAENQVANGSFSMAYRGLQPGLQYRLRTTMITESGLVTGVSAKNVTVQVVQKPC